MSYEVNQTKLTAFLSRMVGLNDRYCELVEELFRQYVGLSSPLTDTGLEFLLSVGVLEPKGHDGLGSFSGVSFENDNRVSDDDLPF